ncbi:MAG: hypothetical protein MK132_01940 [Lentisphaerales bacterium]|nr:hypothetical protein [Lentisphaerales bacterium]
MKLLMILFIVPYFLFAQGERPEEEKGKRKGPFKGDMFKDREAKMERVQKMLEHKNPEKYAALMKLREDSPEKFREEMRKVLREFSEKLGRMKPYGGPYGAGGGERHWLREMSEKNPEKYAALMKLREDSPEKFRAQIAKEFSSRMKKRPMMDPKMQEAIHEATKSYHEAPEDQKDAAKSTLRKLMLESFEQDLKHRRQMADRLEKHLSEVKAQIEAREKNADSVIEERMNFLLEKTSGKKPKKP